MQFDKAFDTKMKVKLTPEYQAGKEVAPGINVTNNNRSLREEVWGYKYLRVIEEDDIRKPEPKQRLSKEYHLKLRKVLKSKLNNETSFKQVKESKRCFDSATWYWKI